MSIELENKWAMAVKENADLRQQLAEARAEYERVKGENLKWIDHARRLFRLKCKYRQDAAAQAAELATLRAVQKLTFDALGRSQDVGRDLMQENATLRERLAEYAEVLRECRVVVDKHRGFIDLHPIVVKKLEGLLARIDALLGAKGVGDALR